MPTDAVWPAKLTPPRTARAVSRPRLFARLDRARGDAAAIWISGDPGAGKTTLMASWIERRRLPRLWYHVDSADAELPTFFHHLGLAARAASRGKPRPLPLLVPEYQGDVETFARRFFRALFSRLRPGTVVVLDDVQEVSPESAFFAMIRHAVEEAPSGVFLLLASRRDLPPALARLRANHALSVVPRRELHLSAAEARALARTWRIRTRADAERLRRFVDGWTAGFVLMLARARACTAAPATTVAMAAATFDYFAGEILDRVDPLARRVLLETSLLPATTGELASAATGLPEAARVLESISRRGLFTTRHCAGDDAYEFHRLFQEFLRRRADDELSPERRSEVRRAAAALLATRGDAGVESAIGLLADAGAFAEMASLVVRQAPAVLAAGRSELVERWLARLPEPLREGEPWLVLVGARARLARDPAAARGRFERVFALAAERADATCAWLAWVGIIESIAFERLDFSRLEPWVDAYQRLRERVGAPPAGEAAAAVALAAVTVLVSYRPEDPTFRELAEAAKEVALAPGDPRLRLVAGAYYCGFHGFWRGDLPRVRPLVDVLRSLAVSPDADPLAAILWHTVEASIHIVGGDGATALATIEAGIRIATERGVHVWDFPLHVMAAIAALCADDLARARGFADGAEALADAASTLDVGVAAGIDAIVAQREGARDEAAARARTAQDVLQRGGFTVHKLYADVTLARALFAVGDLDGAEAHLALLRAPAARMQSHYFLHLASLIDAELRLRRDGPAAALGPLREALALSRQCGLHSHLVHSPADVAPLYALALANAIEPEHVRRLIRRRGVPPPPEAGGEWPWALRVRVLGASEVVREDGTAPDPVRSRRPLTLLRALIALGGREVRETALVDALWPDADADAAHHALETALYRLRREVGQDTIIQRGRRLSLAPARCWVDALELEPRLAASLARAEHRGRPDSAALRVDADRIVSLHRGPLFDREEVAWAVAARERLRRKIVRWLDALAALPGDPAGAVDIESRLTRVDPELRGNVRGA